MNRSFKCVGLASAFSLCLVISASAHVLTDTMTRPGNCDTPVIMLPLPDITATLPDRLQSELIDWIARATDYDTAATRARPPSVSVCDVGDLIDYQDDLLIVPEGLRGAYDLENRRILLVRPWTANSLLDRSVLLHELIHHVQLLNRVWDCPQAPEWQAYKQQEKWLAEHGIDSGFDWLHVYFKASCPRDHHP